MLDVMESVVDAVRGLRVAVFDIEVYSTSGGFPRRGDPVIMASYASFTLGEDIFTEDWAYKRVEVLVADEVGYGGSRRLARRLLELVERDRPLYILTYNGSAFDLPYLEPFAPGSWRVSPDAICRGRYCAVHIDLMLLRESAGPALGVRSHAAHALDDVAMEVVSQLSRYVDMSWLPRSRLMEAEARVNPARIREVLERDEGLAREYSRADAYLTALLARIWMYPLLMLAVLTGVPAGTLHKLNVGQVAEYLEVEAYTRLGLWPSLRERRYRFGRVQGPASDPVYTMGKVYARSPGVHGGPGSRVIELDFEQLYPTDMVVHSADPVESFTRGDVGRWSRERGADILLTDGERRLETRVYHGFGVTSWLAVKMYTARRETKALKKRARAEGRPELEAPDQAVKILVNSFYGAHSKSRGNLVNEAMAAGVFWRTQRLLYDVIRFIDRELPRLLGVKPGDVYVAYGDTDSAYIVAPESVDPERVERLVNEYVRARHGPLYTMALEDVYDAIIIPRRLGATEASAKSYICLKDGRVVKLRGEFYKLEAPLGVRDELVEFWERVISTRPCSTDSIVSAALGLLEGQPLYKWFWKKSVHLAEEGRPKSLNRGFHYAALHTLLVHRTECVKVEVDDGRRAVYTVDPACVEETQRTVVTLYLPGAAPRRPVVYVDDDGSSVEVHMVSVVRVSVDGGVYRVEEYYRAARMDAGELRYRVSAAFRRIAETVARKLCPVLSDARLS
jgi:hypothetical protein